MRIVDQLVTTFLIFMGNTAYVSSSFGPLVLQLSVEKTAHLGPLLTNSRSGMQPLPISLQVVTHSKPARDHMDHAPFRQEGIANAPESRISARSPKEVSNLRLRYLVRSADV